MRLARRARRAGIFARRVLLDPAGLRLILSVRLNGLTYLNPLALLDLRDQVREVDRTGVPGMIIEAGCALGGSAIVLAVTKKDSRQLLVYDVFDMIPPPSERDGDDIVERYRVISSGESEGIKGNTYYGYEPDLLEMVRRNFERFGIDLNRERVHLVRGLFQDTIHPDEAVALAHIDGDWYESVAVCLRRIWPVLVPGGIIVVDDYDAWSGCRQAVDEFLRETKGIRTERRSRLHLVKL